MSEILLLFTKVPRDLNNDLTERSAYADLASPESAWWDYDPKLIANLEEIGAQGSSIGETTTESLDFLCDESLSFLSDVSEPIEDLSNENLPSTYNLTGPPSTLALAGSTANEVDVFVKTTLSLMQTANVQRTSSRPKSPLVKEPSEVSIATVNTHTSARLPKWPMDIPVAISARPALARQPSRPVLRERPSILQKLTSKLKRSEPRLR